MKACLPIQSKNFHRHKTTLKLISYLADLESKKYTDFSQKGVGTAILGYANSEIDNKVSKY